MLIPICQTGKVNAYSGETEITRKHIQTWVGNFGKFEKVPIGPGHLDMANYSLSDTDKKPYCWIAGLYDMGDYCFAYATDWTPEGREAALNNEFKNFSIETTGGDEDRIKYVAALGAYDSAVDFKTPDGERFQPWDFAQGSLGLGAEGQLMLAAAMGVTMPYKSPPKKINDLFDDDAGPAAWTKAFNAAFEEYDGDEAKANATAWATIKKMGYTKGDDGKYRKSKQAATAAKQGGHMSLKEKVLAALKDLTVKLEGEPEEVAEAEPKPIEAAAAPEAKPDSEVLALAARVDELEKRNKEYAAELQMADAMAQARKLCEAAHIAPKFERPMAQYLAGKPEIELAEPERDAEGNVTKEYKMSRNDFICAVLVDKGTKALDDPKTLADAPKKRPVEAVVFEPGVTSEDRQAEIVKEAKAEALAAGKADDKALIASLIKAKMSEVK